MDHAVAQGLAAGRMVHLLSIDNYRIGGAQQLQAYAAILGVPFTAVDTPLALAGAIASAPPSALVLIDTPGYSAADLRDAGGGLAQFLSNRQDIDTHLVLTASMRAVDVARLARRFDVFRPAKLLFTHLDDTESYASIFCEAARSGRPLSFFCHGQQVPEDLA